MKTTHFPNQARTEFKAVPGILGNWQLEPHKALSLLDLSRDLADSQRPALSLSSVQIERASLVLNVHASLREIFQNREIIKVSCTPRTTIALSAAPLWFPSCSRATSKG